MLRALYTFINSKLPTRTTKKEHHRRFTKLDLISADRFDKMIETVTHRVKNKYASAERPKK